METIKLTKKEAINEIIGNTAGNQNSTILLYHGFKGYNNMTLDEIREYHYDIIGKFEKDNGVKYIIE